MLLQGILEIMIQMCNQLVFNKGDYLDSLGGPSSLMAVQYRAEASLKWCLLDSTTVAAQQVLECSRMVLDSSMTG